MRAALLGALLALSPVLPALAQPTPQTLTLDEAMAHAVHALRIGQPEVTLQLTGGLLQARPRDPVLHYLQSVAYAGLNRPDDGRKSAARSYRFSRDSASRFEAAQMAARLSVQANRPTMAQVWLRRTAIHAPDEAAEAAIARDYRTLRQINPWAFRLRAELKPSSNVNNGADSALQIIDGVPVTGVLVGAARALSGVIGVLDLASTYRLRHSDRSLTSVGGRVYIQRVKLSSDAMAIAPNARDSDYASTYAELSLRHVLAVGSESNPGSAAVDVAAGTSWWGGEKSYNFARLTGERTWQLANGASVEVNALAESRFSARFGSDDADIVGLGGRFVRPLQNRNQLTLSFALRNTKARWANGSFRSGSVRAAYAFGRPVGPVRVSTALVLGYSDYPSYISGLFRVPGGRQDKSVYGDVNLFFEQYDYAGFAPVLRMRAGRKSSNDSRFDTQEFSVSLGVESKF